MTQLLVRSASAAVDRGIASLDELEPAERRLIDALDGAG